MRLLRSRVAQSEIVIQSIPHEQVGSKSSYLSSLVGMPGWQTDRQQVARREKLRKMGPIPQVVLLVVILVVDVWALRGNSGYCLRYELLDGEIFDTVLEARVVTETWRREYNTIRPHSSLGDRSPAPEAYRSLQPANA